MIYLSHLNATLFLHVNLNFFGALYAANDNAVVEYNFVGNAPSFSSINNSLPAYALTPFPVGVYLFLLALTDLGLMRGRNA